MNEQKIATARVRICNTQRQLHTNTPNVEKIKNNEHTRYKLRVVFFQQIHNNNSKMRVMNNLQKAFTLFFFLSFPIFYIRDPERMNSHTNYLFMYCTVLCCILQIDIE